MKRTLLLGLAIAVSGVSHSVRAASWQIDQSRYNALLCSSGMAGQACGQPPRVGNFATRDECQKARHLGHLGQDQVWLSHTDCVPKVEPAEAAGRAAEETGTAQVERANQEFEAARRKALFETERAEVLATLKGGADGGANRQELGIKSPPPSAGGSASAAGALRELDCAAYWALAAARQAAGGAPEAARSDALRAAQAQGARTKGCPPPAADFPQPTPVIDSPPQADALRQIIEQARKIQTLLTRNQQKLAATRARRDKTAQEVARLKRQATSNDKNDAAERKAREALAAAEKLEQELAKLDASIAQSEGEQKRLLGELDALQGRYQAAAGQQ